jgi:hypothetical protein
MGAEAREALWQAARQVVAACKTRYEMEGAEIAYPDIQADYSKGERSI